MNDFTPPQLKAIQGWTEQRDALFEQIRIYSIELDTKKVLDKEAGLALDDKHRQIAEAEGRISVLDRLEESKKNSVSIEVAELTARKSRLEAECIAKDQELASAEKQRAITVVATTDLIAAHDTMKDQAAIVDSVAGRLIEMSKNALSEVKTTMEEIRTVSADVIAKGNENIAQTGIILEKLPKYIFELQRPIPVRRHYPDGHPRAVLSAPEIPVEATQV